MEENFKLYSQKAIAIATYFGGPIAAGILVRRNCLNLGKEKQAVNSLIIGIISTLLIFAAIYSIPEHIIEKVPNVIIPAIYTGIIYLIVEKIQGKELNTHKENNGEFYSGWKAAGIGVIFSVLYIVLIFGYVYASEDEYNFDTNTYTSELNKILANEEKALQAYNFVETRDKELVIREFSKGLVLWKENINTVERIFQIENLPNDAIEFNKNLKLYLELRIKSYEIIINGISEETDKYSSELQKLQAEIDKVTKKLN